MQVLYIDIYFLINFTMDFLSMYFASALTKVRCTRWRLILSSLLGALLACLVVIILPQGITYIMIALFGAIGACAIAMERFQGILLLKLFFAYFLLQTVLGGLISYLFTLLDESLLPLMPSIEEAAENRKLLLLSIFVLIAYGIIKLILWLLGDSANTRIYDIKIKILDIELKLQGLYDSANMLRDPMDSRPVAIVKRSALKMIFEKYGDNALSDSTGALASRVRIIPAHGIGGEQILMGLRPDSVYVLENRGQRHTDITIAIDDSEGSYGGYNVLLPKELYN